MWRKELFRVLCLWCMLWGQSTRAEVNCEGKEKSSLSLEIAENLIKMSKEMIPDCTETVRNTSECGSKVKLCAYLDMAKKLISEARENYSTSIDDIAGDLNITKPTIVTTEVEGLTTKEPIEYPKDCFEVLQNGRNTSGVYRIWLESSSPKNREEMGRPGRSLEVFCDMDSDGGGWTVIQRRGNFTPQEDFFRDWEDYKNGFGRITKDFWIGNKHLFALTRQSQYRARFDLEDVRGTKTYLLYETFWIEDETSYYKLHIGGYGSTAGDSMYYSNNMNFSTKGRDHDNAPLNDCAGTIRRGGWWYNNCGDCNPNGLYLPGANHHRSMYWKHWRGYVGLAATEIKLKRKYE